MELKEKKFYKDTFKDKFNITRNYIVSKKYIHGISRALGYENIFVCHNRNRYSLLDKNKKIIPDEKNTFYLAKTHNGNDFIFSFQELDTQLYIKDKTFKTQQKIMFELLNKEKKMITFFNNEKTYTETKKIFEEQKREYLEINNNFCFRLKKEEELSKFLIGIFEYDIPKHYILDSNKEEVQNIRNNFSKFANILPIIIDSYFENKTMESQDFFNVDAKNIKNIIQHFKNFIEENQIEEKYVYYINILIDSLNKIIPSLAENFDPNFDFFYSMQKRENIIVFSENRYCERIFFILNNINYENLVNYEIEYIDFRKNPYFILLENLKDLEFLLKSQALQVQSSPNRAFRKTLILSNTDFFNSGFASHNIVRLEYGNDTCIYYNNTNSALLKI